MYYEELHWFLRIKFYVGYNVSMKCEMNIHINTIHFFKDLFIFYSQNKIFVENLFEIN